MFLIVNDAFEASAQSPTLAEKAARCETWSRLLFGVIPENRLQETFETAFRNHKTNFPISAYDMKLAWEEIAKNQTVDFSFCKLGCHPATGLIETVVDGERWMTKCKHGES